MIVRTGLPEPYFRLFGETPEAAKTRMDARAKAWADAEAARMARTVTTARMIWLLLAALIRHGNKRVACTAYQRNEPCGEIYVDGDYLVIGGS